jgi:hypothetical protein
MTFTERSFSIEGCKEKNLFHSVEKQASGKGGYFILKPIFAA